MKLTYLLIDFCSILIPFAFSFHPKIQFNFKNFLFANIPVAVFFIIWDSIFTSLKVWGFNSKYVVGLTIFNLPIEEMLFFICIPFACVFSYHCIQKLFLKNRTFNFESTFTPILILLLLLLATIYIDKLYTSLTFILLAGSLFSLKYVFKVKWLGGFYITYSILFFPFLLTNGILTGSLINEPIVWYDDGNIIGVRIITIPVEDIFYGMLLIVMNVSIYLILKDHYFHRISKEK